MGKCWWLVVWGLAITHQSLVLAVHKQNGCSVRQLSNHMLDLKATKRWSFYTPKHTGKETLSMAATRVHCKERCCANSQCSGFTLKKLAKAKHAYSCVMMDCGKGHLCTYMPSNGSTIYIMKRDGGKALHHSVTHPDVTTPNATHGVTTPNATHGVTTPNPTHGVTTQRLAAKRMTTRSVLKTTHHNLKLSTQPASSNPSNKVKKLSTLTTAGFRATTSNAILNATTQHAAAGQTTPGAPLQATTKDLRHTVHVQPVHSSKSSKNTKLSASKTGPSKGHSSITTGKTHLKTTSQTTVKTPISTASLQHTSTRSKQLPVTYKGAKKTSTPQATQHPTGIPHSRTTSRKQKWTTTTTEASHHSDMTKATKKPKYQNILVVGTEGPGVAPEPSLSNAERKMLLTILAVSSLFTIIIAVILIFYCVRNTDYQRRKRKGYKHLKPV